MLQRILQTKKKLM